MNIPDGISTYFCPSWTHFLGHTGVRMKRKPDVRECRKRFDGRCFFCPEATYEALHAHRIVHGKDGGVYHWANLLTVCASCHEKIHAGLIVVHSRRRTTLGLSVIHYTTRGQEHWAREDF